MFLQYDTVTTVIVLNDYLIHQNVQHKLWIMSLSFELFLYLNDFSQ